MTDFIFVEKPSGFNTHESHPWRLGFVEYLEKKLGKRLYIVSRLDQGTSGAMVLPLTVEATREMTELFAKKKVFKTYMFLTAHRNPQKSLHALSFIDKHRNTFKSFLDREPNAETHFRFVKPVGKYFLWEAHPLTGKSHQIRLHAQDLGIPILGDTEHGGTEFFRLCLHCQQLEFTWQGEKVVYDAQEPAWAKDAPISEWVFQEAVEKRKVLLDRGLLEYESYRLVHQESRILKIDVFGPQVWAYRYRVNELSPEEIQFWIKVSEQLGKPLLVKNMVNRGKHPHDGATWSHGDFKEVWQAQENGLTYEMRSNIGQSPGLFLDQRENRQWVQNNAKGKKVLNLFCYTGAFSLAAAKGGATQVSSVDVSKNFLNWARRNFALNNLDPAQYEFWDSDAMLFLKGATKLSRLWNLVICDPPSFGRSREGIFQIHKDLPRLIELCTQVTAPQGQILFSTNFEQWSMNDLHKVLSAQKSLHHWTIKPAAGPGLDFELSEDPVLKSFILSRA